MIRFIPVTNHILIERANQSKAIVMPDKVEPVSDDVFTVAGIGPDVKKVRVGELICVVGYINTFSYKGTKGILTTENEVVCTIKEK